VRKRIPFELSSVTDMLMKTRNGRQKPDTSPSEPNNQFCTRNLPPSKRCRIAPSSTIARVGSNPACRNYVFAVTSCTTQNANQSHQAPETVSPRQTTQKRRVSQLPTRSLRLLRHAHLKN